MPTVQSVLDALEGIAPSALAFSFDRIGLQVGDRNAPVRRGLLSLDRSRSAVAHAVSVGAEMLVTHHPLFFDPLVCVDFGEHAGATIADLLRGGVALATAHTNWDCAKGGINDALMEALGLAVDGEFGMHSGSGQPGGRLATLPESIPLEAFAALVDERLGTHSWAWGADALVRRVAVVGGAADGEWKAAQAAGADVLVTGEVKQHNALEAAESGFAILASGHYATEMPGVLRLAERLRETTPEVEWLVFEPKKGNSGKPL